MSSLCFDAFNLDNAVKAVIASVRDKGQAYLPVVGTGKRIDIANTQEVREHLMNQALKRYQQCREAGGVEIARIEGVIYSPVGFVFEHAPEIITPAPPVPAGQPELERYTHQAYFWSVL
ncbi:MAG: hypothetical protein ACOZE7_04465 [Pseudomonadota bacterium]